MENLFESLNEQQILAVTTTEGPIRVVAGAGSGKTLALTRRYVYIVNELGISSTNILCVTFTNKAANVMRERIRSMIGDFDSSYICTFHGLGLKIIREEANFIGYPEMFPIMDEEDQETLLKVIYSDLNITSSILSFKDCKDYIHDSKVSMQYCKYFIDINNERLLTDIENADNLNKKIFLKYLLLQKKNFAMDFDDLIFVALYILFNNKNICEKWQKRFMYIMVDEFQDVSVYNYSLVDLLSKYYNNFFIVGDPDQNIYSWRGADVRFINDFDKIHPNTKTIILDKNYRSTNNILKVSNSLIQKNKNRIEKNLYSDFNDDLEVMYNHCDNQFKEAKWIADEIKKLVDNNVCNYSDITVLYRSHFLTRQIEETFLKENIAYQIYSGISFYQRKEIKDVLSYLKLIVFGDDISFLRVVNEPKRNIGDKRIAILKTYSEQNNCNLFKALKLNLQTDKFKTTKAEEFVNLIEKYEKIYSSISVSDLIDSLIKESGYEEILRLSSDEDRLNNLMELKDSIIQLEKNRGEDFSLKEYLQDITLLTNIDSEDKKNHVKLMTVHSSKGMEFQNVFVYGLTEGIFPSSKSKTVLEIEEERRLAYVAFTRAEKRLFLSSSGGFNFDNSQRMPSRFISNIDKSLLHYLNENVSFKSYDTQDRNDYTIFKTGTKVKHKIFGIGTIVNINNTEKCYEIKFDNIDSLRNISFMFKLEKIDNVIPVNDCIENYDISGTTSISNLLQINKIYTIIGVIKNLHITQRKKDGANMAFFEIKDKTGKIEAACFTEQFNLYGELLHEDEIVKLIGVYQEENSSTNNIKKIYIKEIFKPDLIKK